MATTHRNGRATSAGQVSDFTQRRDGSCAGVRRPGRSAPNRSSRSGPRPFRDGDCHRQWVTPQKPLRADGPVKQNVELDPRRVTASGRPAAEELRPPSARGDFHRPRRLSSSALGRRAASGGRWLNTGRMSSGHRHGGQSKRVGSGVGRSEACSGSSPRGGLVASRSPLVPQFGS